MYRKLLLTAALTASFAVSAFAATAPAGKWYVEITGGKCSAVQSATAPTNIAKGSATKGYANQGAANTELGKLQKTKPPVCAAS